MTYIHEVHAQFAREAMACQSMDNEEILNVRWATEDPNPTTKVIEKRRLEEIGTAAISAKLDPRVVDAMRSVRALEDGEELEVEEFPPLDEVDEPPRKRQHVEEQALKPGLLSEETLMGLRALSEARNKRTGGQPVRKPGLSSLMAYGSDSDNSD